MIAIAVDDEVLMLGALVKAIKASPDISAVADFTSGEDALEFIKNNPDKIVWCGEFGNIRHAKMEWRIAWFKDVISFLKENEIPYSVWNYLSTPNDGNRFSLTDDETREMLSEELHQILLGNF